MAYKIWRKVFDRSCHPKRSGEHVGLVNHQLVPDRLEMQPPDIIAADMFAAVAGAVGGDADWLNT